MSGIIIEHPFERETNLKIEIDWNKSMRAKFYVVKIIKNGTFTYTESGIKEEVTGEHLFMSPVCPSEFGDKGEHEDNDFHRWSPSGNFDVYITNPDLFGKFNIGEKYYLDFSKSNK